MADKFCTKCGAKMREGSAFCGVCGERLEESISRQDESTVNSLDSFGTLDTNNISSPDNPSPEDVFFGDAQKNGNKPSGKGGKIFGIILAVLIAIVVAAYFIGASDKNNDSSEDGSYTQNQDKEYDQEKTDKTDKTDDYDIDKKSYPKGYIVGEKYKSDFIGIEFDAPSSWAYATEDELKDMQTDDVTSWEMMCIDSYTGSNVIVAVEELVLSSISEEMYYDSLMRNIDLDGEMELTSEKGDTAYLAGDKYHVLSYNVKSEGIEYSQFFYYKKIDKYMACILVTNTTDDVEDILDCFNSY